jgi:hypothetical protein
MMDDPQEAQDLEDIQDEFPGIVAFVRDRFYEARAARNSVDIRLYQAYEDFRGRYSGNVTFKDTERSQVFVKIAKTKTLAAFGQLTEVIFSGNKFPIGISPTERPTGIAEKAHLKGPKEDAEEPIIPKELAVGYPGDGHKSAFDAIVGGLKAKFKGADFVMGQNPDPKGVTISPAQLAAEEMEKTVRDQLTESHASRELRSAILESALYGTGIIKGPFSYDKTLNKWDTEISKDDPSDIRKTYNPTTVNVPRIEFVSVWDFYPDPSATTIEECEFAIQRHKLNRSQMRGLANRPFFNLDGIRNSITAGPNYHSEGYEDDVRDTDYNYDDTTRWEVLEYWGVMDHQLALEAGMEVDPSEVDVMNEVQINIWVCNNEILRAVINPFEPERIPFHVFPYEKNPNELFGVGVPENMADATQIMNGHARMAIDNLALSGHVILEVDETSLVSGQDMTLFPGKTFRRQSGSAGTAITAVKIPNTTQQNMEMFDKFRQLADESTGIPSYSHGASGGAGTTRTASGMSMLMGAASLNIKTVVKNLDDYLLKPLGEAMFHWNMQFNPDARVTGDLDVKALGTEAIMQKEVRSQRLTQFMQTAFSNPITAPLANGEYILEELGKTLDLDPEMLVNGPAKAQFQAELMKTSGSGEAMGAASLNLGDTGTGDGTMGTGGAPMPGEDSFSGNTGEEPLS